MLDLSFFRNKNVLVTGHTGFKGSWLCHILINAGANVTGYALEPPTSPSLFEISGISKNMNSVIGDIRDRKKIEKLFEDVNPEIVFHLAAQPIVRESYVNPVYTYETNVMGTVNILECIRKSQSVKSVVNVTTDKVYLNKEWVWGYRESDELDGYDPYSNSKSCSELVTHSYVNSFLRQRGVAVSTVRAGNVIGGGDFAKDRIVPDCIRAAMDNKAIIVRNPNSVRPYQHVLEPLFAYLMIAAKQYDDASFVGCYNVGPDDSNCVCTGELADTFVKEWGNGLKWMVQGDGGPHEANFLKLDCAKLKSVFDWKPRWDINKSVSATIEWTKCWLNNKDIIKCMNNQIEAYLLD